MEERLGANLLVCSMPEGQTRTTCSVAIRRSGIAGRQAKPLVEYYLGVAAKQLDLTSAAGKGALGANWRR